MRTERANPKIEEERKAAGNAKAILGWLTPSNARTDRLIFVLRNAANVATTATLTRLESKKALDALRDGAANSLNAVCGLLDRGALTREVIDQANRAVSLWVDALPVGRRQSPDERRGPAHGSELRQAAGAIAAALGWQAHVLRHWPIDRIAAVVRIR